MSSNNLRRSAHIRDENYQPRKTWSLPTIVSVTSFSFELTILSVFNTLLCIQCIPDHGSSHNMNAKFFENDHGMFLMLSLTIFSLFLKKKRGGTPPLNAHHQWMLTKDIVLQGVSVCVLNKMS